MKELLKNNRAFLTIYLLFAISICILLFFNGKQDAQLFANQFYNPFFDGLFFYSTKIVEWFSFILLITIFLFRGAKYAINGLIIFGTTVLITFSLKRLVFTQAMRPTFDNNIFRIIPDIYELDQRTGFSFPSGHTTAAFTLFCFLAIITARKRLGVVFGIIAILIGYSRIYLSQHYFEDILAGATIGTFATLILYYFLDKIKYGNWALKPIFNLKK